MKAISLLAALTVGRVFEVPSLCLRKVHFLLGGLSQPCFVLRNVEGKSLGCLMKQRNVWQGMGAVDFT